MAQALRRPAAQNVQARAAARPAQQKIEGDTIDRQGWGFLYSAFRLYTSAAAPVAVTPIAQQYALFQSFDGDGTGSQGFAGLQQCALQTNMTRAGQMPNERGFVATRLGFFARPDVPVSAANKLSAWGVLHYFTPGWELDLGPAMLWPGGVGASGFSNVGGRELGSLGLASPSTMRKLEVPFKLKKGKTFNFQYRIYAGFLPTILPSEQIALQPVDIYIALWGRWDTSI